MVLIQFVQRVASDKTHCKPSDLLICEQWELGWTHWLGMVKRGEPSVLSHKFIFTISTFLISDIILSAAKLAEFEIVSKILRHY